MTATALTTLFTLVLGPWFISYNTETSLLTLQNRERNVVLTGSFDCENGTGPLSIVLPFDNKPNRLALADRKGVILAFVAFQQNGDEVSFLIYPRITKLLYPAKFRFDGEVTFRPDGYACRSKPRELEQIVTFETGRADSRLNNALFSPENDLMLSFTGWQPKIETLRNGKFRVSCSSDLAGSFGMKVEKDYYRTRWVPYYTPIDRKRAPKPPTGWMSWNVYFDKAGAAENLAEARIGKEKLLPFGLEFWSIESWQENSDKIPVANFHNLDLKQHPKQFPDGMKKLADDIRALGFRPGLWYVPWGTGDKSFYDAHKNWFLHESDGSPVHAWPGTYILDVSHPEVRKHTREKLQIASKDWGYEFFKIDGMAYNPRHAPYHFERPELRPKMKQPNAGNPYENFVRDMREAIGSGRVFLTCRGTITGPEVQFADASRIGADIVSPGCPVTWANLLDQGRETLRRLFTNNIVYYNDPDTLLVNRALSLEEARVTTTVVSLPGQMMFAGDKLAELPEERMALLQKALPVCDVHPMDLFPIDKLLPIWDLKVRRPFLSWDVVALFNWSEKPNSITLDLNEIGLDPNRHYVMYEFWTGQYFGKADKKLMLDVPAHAVRLLAVHAIRDVPQFLSSDRHVTQGAVDLADLKFEEKQLTGGVKIVAGHPTTLRFRIPEKWKLQKSSAKQAVIRSAFEQNGEVLAVTIESKKSTEICFVLEFEKK